MKRLLLLYISLLAIISCVTIQKNNFTSSIVETTQHLKNKYEDSIYRVVLKINNVERGYGTGFKVDKWVFTAAHVCDIGTKTVDYYLETKNGLNAKTNLVHIWETHDLCALEAPDDGATPFKIGSPQFDDWGVLIGFPQMSFLTASFGMILGQQYIAMPANKPLKECKGGTLKIVEHRTFVGIKKICTRTDLYLVTKIRTYPGSSGGPIINTDGEIIGISSLTSTTTYWAKIISSDFLKDFIDELVEKESYR